MERTKAQVISEIDSALYDYVEDYIRGLDFTDTPGREITLIAGNVRAFSYRLSNDIPTLAGLLYERKHRAE
jgi:hypothetical protein